MGWSSPLLLGDNYTASAAEMADSSTKGIIRVLNYSSIREEIWSPLHEIANLVEKLEFPTTFVNPRLLHNRFSCRHATLLPPHPRAFLLLPGDFSFLVYLHAYSSIAYRLASKGSCERYISDNINYTNELENQKSKLWVGRLTNCKLNQ